MSNPGKRKVLIFSDCDFGQANVVLSTIYALVCADPNVEIHVASQPGMQGQLSRIIKQVSNDLGSAAAESIKTHDLVGLSHWEAMERPGNPNLDSWACDPTIPNMVSMLSVLPGITLPWSAEEFVEIYRDVELYMNLGTHRSFDVAKATEVAYAFRSLFDAAKTSHLSNLQLIWKMPRVASEGDTSGFEGPWKEIKDILESEIDQDRVKIVDWITAEPKSLLQSGHVVCSVNHGGSNSFHEAICCGIPQVILPGWADCYDFALRAEFLGIGRWASRTARPLWKRDELAKGLEEVLLGPQAMEMIKRAQELAKRHPEGAGRDRAAEEILKLLDGNNTNGVNGKH
ncbi:hypothetical protein Brms1b_010154 [Colletotrichum noveboracense]|nr:hypothetical protein Brms1b_010154 [Colletotrichum noveboracense]